MSRGNFLLAIKQRFSAVLFERTFGSG